jgi:hypothetical protein
MGPAIWGHKATAAGIKCASAAVSEKSLYLGII